MEGRLELHFLPPYAPDLNPDEFVWSYMKGTGVSKKPLKQNESMRQRVEEDLAKIQNNRNLVRSFFWCRKCSLCFGLISKSSVIWDNVTSLWHGTWPVWSWSADGKSFYQPKLTRRKGFTALVRHDLDTSATNEFPIPENWNSTILSPNCEQVAFSITKTNGNSLTRTVNVVPLNGGEPRELVAMSGPDWILNLAADRGLGWTPDNRHVLFVRGNSKNPQARELWRVSAAGGDPEPLGLGMNGLRTPVISPDGHWIAFTVGGPKTELWVMENFLAKDKVAAK